MRTPAHSLEAAEKTQTQLTVPTDIARLHSVPTATAPSASSWIPTPLSRRLPSEPTATACLAPATRHGPLQDGTLKRVGCIQRLGRTLIVPDPTLASEEEEEDSDMREEDTERASLWQDVQELVAGAQIPCCASTKVLA